MTEPSYTHSVMMAPIIKSRVLIPMEIYADFVCPWCFITKRALEKVMAKFTSKHPEVEFEVTWRPYYVNAMFTGSAYLPHSSS